MKPEAKTRQRSPDAGLKNAQLRETSSRLVETYLWLLLAILIGVRALVEILTRVAPPYEVFSVRYQELLAACGVFLFPIIYRLIFGALPLESLRRRRAQRQLESSEPVTNRDEPTDIQATELSVLSESLGTDEMATSRATKLFAYYASSSRRLSQSIYSRAGVYLLVGVFVAFSGLAFFYAQTAQVTTLPQEGLSLLISFAPKFGILFFIELVAFFFLRQYRSVMDEFRYYEAIKRSREETLALIRIAEDIGKPFDPIDFVKSGSFFSKAGVIAKGESSEIIESRKLEKNELDLLEKVIDVVSRGKR